MLLLPIWSKVKVDRQTDNDSSGAGSRLTAIFLEQGKSQILKNFLEHGKGQILIIFLEQGKGQILITFLEQGKLSADNDFFGAMSRLTADNDLSRVS